MVLNDIKLQVQDPMRLYYDNKIAINLSNNIILHDCTKHVELDWYFISKKIVFKELIFSYIKT